MLNACTSTSIHKVLNYFGITESLTRGILGLYYCNLPYGKCLLKVRSYGSLKVRLLYHRVGKYLLYCRYSKRATIITLPTYLIPYAIRRQEH